MLFYHPVSEATPDSKITGAYYIGGLLPIVVDLDPYTDPEIVLDPSSSGSEMNLKYL